MILALGAHVINGSADTARWAREGHLPIVLLMNAWGDAAEYHRQGALVVGRKYIEPCDPNGLWEQGADPKAEAWRYVHGLWQGSMATLGANILANPGVDLWVGPNEPQFADPRAMGWYATFEIERMRLLHELGTGAAIGCFSTGTPELPQDDPRYWDAFLPALRGMGSRDRLALHEYWGRANFGWGWLAGRYRAVWAHVGKIPTIVTECGWDNIPQVNGKPFKAEGSPAGEYAGELVTYGRECAGDGVLATVFTFGVGGWEGHTVEGQAVVDILISASNEDIPKPPEPPTPSVADVIDVSRYQQTIHWQTVKGAGVQAAFIRASQGLTYTDPYFTQNWSGAKTAGLLRGAYHFFEPEMDGGEQARRFWSRLEGDHGELLPALDLEANYTLASPMLAGAMAFLAEFERLSGVRPMIYTSPGYWAPFAGQAWVADYPLWLAQYTSAPRPSVPLPWRPNGWTLWQYGTARVAGIAGAVDSNRLNGAFGLPNWAEKESTVSVNVMTILVANEETGSKFVQHVMDAADDFRTRGDVYPYGPPMPPTPPPSEVVRANVNGINVRSSPDTSSNANVLGQLAAGETLPLVGRVTVGGLVWYRVVYKSFPEAMISSKASVSVQGV